MSDNAAVPLVVVSSARDPVEALNSLLRRQGVPAHCTWIPAVQDLPEALEQLNPQMLFCVASASADPADIAKIRDRTTPDVPLMVIRSEIVGSGDRAGHGRRRARQHFTWKARVAPMRSSRAN